MNLPQPIAEALAPFAPPAVRIRVHPDDARELLIHALVLAKQCRQQAAEEKRYADRVPSSADQFETTARFWDRLAEAAAASLAEPDRTTPGDGRAV